MGGRGRLRAEGEGGGSVWARIERNGGLLLLLLDFVGVLTTWSSSSSCSETVYECFNFEGEVIGDAAFRLGGVAGRSLTAVGDPGDAGRRKGEERGELSEDLNEACNGSQPREEAS